MTRILAKSVLQLLLPGQKDHAATVASDMIRAATSEPGLLKKIITLNGTEVSLSSIPCFLYLVSSTINASIFHSTWMDTFRTDLIGLNYDLMDGTAMII